MTAKGYKGITVKEGVVERLREAAKAEDMTLSALLDSLLEKDEKGGEGFLEKYKKEIMKVEGDIRQIVREEMKEVMEGFRR